VLGILFRLQRTIAWVLALTSLLILLGHFLYFDVTPRVVIPLLGTTIGFLLFLGVSILAEASNLGGDPVGRGSSFLSAAQLISFRVSTLFSNNPALLERRKRAPAWLGFAMRRGCVRSEVVDAARRACNPESGL
jgi:hypothetical protein